MQILNGGKAAAKKLIQEDLVISIEPDLIRYDSCTGKQLPSRSCTWIQNKSGSAIALMTGDYRNEECARILAAAPKLLEALKEALTGCAPKVEWANLVQSIDPDAFIYRPEDSDAMDGPHAC